MTQNNLHKIKNQLQEFITFYQILLNSILIFNHLKVINYKSSLSTQLFNNQTISTKDIPVFYDVSDESDD